MIGAARVRMSGDLSSDPALPISPIKLIVGFALVFDRNLRIGPSCGS